MKAIDMVGKKFGMLTVIEEAPKQKYTKRYLCKCDCGNTAVVQGGHLRSGHTQSCGCHTNARIVESNKARAKHGETGTRLYNIWHGMKRRCNSQTAHNYERYGGRGITICKEWNDSYEAFRDWAFRNGYQDGLSIDRIDNDGNYEPGNCRFVNMKVQHNNYSQNVMLEYDGRQQTAVQWAEELGIDVGLIYNRKHRGWSDERILTEGVHEKKGEQYGKFLHGARSP